jgi:DNA-binding CsgD family transcriptional regulator
MDDDSNRLTGDSPAHAPILLLRTTRFQLAPIRWHGAKAKRNLVGGFGCRSLKLGGDALLDPSATWRLIEAYTSGGADHAGATTLPEELTPRELELLALIATGSTNAEIAERLVISTLTVKSHVSRILAKTSARDRTQLVVMAYESGLVVPGTA